MAESKSRLMWACRRGMLELDVLLEPFMRDHYDELSEAEQEAFERLLRCDDPDLFNWFMGHRECPDTDIARLIHVIRCHNQPVA